jgi:hypothetical protein
MPLLDIRTNSVRQPDVFGSALPSWPTENVTMRAVLLPLAALAPPGLSHLHAVGSGRSRERTLVLAIYPRSPSTAAIPAREQAVVAE